MAALLGCYVEMAEWRLGPRPGRRPRPPTSWKAVALKAVGPRLLHKTEAHAVRLGLAGGAKTPVGGHRDGRGGRRRRFEVDGFLVQRMVAGGVELLVGVVHDPSFGPVLACGAGGTAVELLKDVAVRLTPLTDLDAAEMVRSLATFPLLDGYRGAPKADVGALEDLLLRVGALVEAHPEVAELDCNPVEVLPDGVVVVDARVRVEPASPPLPLAARRR